MKYFIVAFVLFFVFISLDCGMSKPVFEVRGTAVFKIFRGKFTGIPWETRCESITKVQK